MDFPIINFVSFSKENPLIIVCSIVASLLTAGTVFLIGALNEFPGYTYPIITSTFLVRAAWDFSSTLAMSSLTFATVLSLSYALWIGYHLTKILLFGPKDTLFKFPEAATYAAVISASVPWMATYTPSTLGLIDIIGMSLLLLVSVFWFGVMKYPDQFKRLAPPANAKRALAALFVLSISYSAGSSWANSIISTRATKITYVDRTELASIIDIGSSGIVVYVDGRDSFMRFVPYSEIKSIEFGFDL